MSSNQRNSRFNNTRPTRGSRFNSSRPNYSNSSYSRGPDLRNTPFSPTINNAVIDDTNRRTDTYTSASPSNSEPRVAQEKSRFSQVPTNTRPSRFQPDKAIQNLPPPLPQSDIPQSKRTSTNAFATSNNHQQQDNRVLPRKKHKTNETKVIFAKKSQRTDTSQQTTETDAKFFGNQFTLNEKSSPVKEVDVAKLIESIKTEKRDYFNAENSKVLKNSNVFINVKDALQFKSLYQKYHTSKAWLSQHVPNCQLGFHRINSTTFYLQLYLFNASDLLFVIFYLFNTNKRRSLSIVFIVHESANFQNDNLPTIAGLEDTSIVKQRIGLNSYPGFTGYRFCIENSQLFLANHEKILKLIKVFNNNNLSFNGNINTIKNKFRKTVTIKCFDFNYTLLSQQLFYSKGGLLKSINQNKVLDDFCKKLNTFTNRDAIKQIKQVEKRERNKNLSSKNTGKSSNDKSKQQQQQQQQQQQPQQPQQQSKQTPVVRISPKSGVTTTTTAQNKSNVDQPQIIGGLTETKVVELCQKIISDSLKKLDEINSKSKSSYEIVKAFIKVPRHLYPDLPELTKFCQVMSFESNCNVIILSYINHHQSVQWFKDLNLPWINQLGETECKILTIGGVVGGCKSAIDLIKRDIEKKVRR